MAYTVMAYMAMVCVVIAHKAMAHIIVACIVMACIVYGLYGEGPQAVAADLDGEAPLQRERSLGAWP